MVIYLQESMIMNVNAGRKDTWVLNKLFDFREGDNQGHTIHYVGVLGIVGQEIKHSVIIQG